MCLYYYKHNGRADKAFQKRPFRATSKTLNKGKIMNKNEVINKFALAILFGELKSPSEYFETAENYTDVVKGILDPSQSVENLSEIKGGEFDVLVHFDMVTYLKDFLSDLHLDMSDEYYTLERTKECLQSSLNQQGINIQL